MTFAVISPPSLAPVTLTQVKQHIRLDHDTEDAYLQELISAATDYVEGNLSQFLISRTVRQYVEDLSVGLVIGLETWPVKEVTAVRGFDADGNESALSSIQFRLLGHCDPAQLEFQASSSIASFPNGLEIDFISGYGDAGTDIPSNLTRAILVLVGHWYEFRGTQPHGDVTALIPDGINKLLAPARRVKL